MELAVFVIALAVIFGVKAFAIARASSDLAEKSASFSWAHLREQDARRAANWEAEKPIKASETTVVYSPMRHAGGAGA